jgi:hypothetical protein
MLSEHCDLAAARAFFRSATAVTNVTPGRVTTDGHDAYPRAIRTELGKHVRHRTSRYLNNRLGQDHRGIKDRCRPMLGLKSTISAACYCRGMTNCETGRSRMRQHVPAAVLPTYAENRDCPSCPGNSLSAGDEGRSLPNSRARKLTEPVADGPSNGALCVSRPPRQMAEADLALGDRPVHADHAFGARTLMAKSLSKSSTAVSSIVAAFETPALATRMTTMAWGI